MPGAISSRKAATAHPSWRLHDAHRFVSDAGRVAVSPVSDSRALSQSCEWYGGNCRIGSVRRIKASADVTTIGYARARARWVR